MKLLEMLGLKSKEPTHRLTVPQNKISDFNVLREMANTYIRERQSMTDDEKARLLKTFWARWDKHVNIDKAREDRKAGRL